MNRRYTKYISGPLAILCVAVCLSGCRRAGPAATPLNEGLAALAEGNFAHAVARLEAAAAADPKSSTAHANLGVAYWRTGRNDPALESFRTAAALAPTDPSPLEYEARVLMSMRLWDDALDVLAQADELSPASSAIRTAMAVAQSRAGRIDQAIGLLLETLAVEPRYEPALYNLAFLSEDREEAALLFRRFIEAAEAREFPDVGRLVKARRFLASVEQRAESAPRPQSEGTEAASPDAGPLQDDGTPEPEVVFPPVAPPTVRARAAVAAGNPDEALVILKQAVESNPDDPDALWELVTLYDRLLRDNERALATLARFKERFPDDLRADSTIRALSGVSGRPEPIEEAAPPPARDTSAALEVWSRGLERHNSGDLDAAKALYREALKLDDELINASYNLGLVYKTEGDIERAREAFMYTLTVKPDMVEAHYMLGVIYWGQEDRAKARGQMAEVLRVNPDYAKAHYLLGMIEVAAGRADLARSHFTRYVRLAPNGASADRARAWMKAHTP